MQGALGKLVFAISVGRRAKSNLPRNLRDRKFIKRGDGASFCVLSGNTDKKKKIIFNQK
jgi:hypothetical protein